MTDGTNHRMTAPTHYCKSCGALWRQHDDFSVSLRSASACAECDNTPVGGQLLPLQSAPDRVERSLQSNIADIMRSWAGSNGGVFTIEACSAEVARYIWAYFGALYALDPKHSRSSPLLTDAEVHQLVIDCQHLRGYDVVRAIEARVRGKA